MHNSSVQSQFRVHINPPQQRHLPPHLFQVVQINLCQCDLALVQPLPVAIFLPAQACHDLAPRVDDDAVTIAPAGSVLVVEAYLCGGYDIRLGLDGTRAEQRFPVCLPRGHGEGRWIGQDVRTAISQCKCRLRKAQVKTNHHAYIAKWGGKRVLDAGPTLDAIALLQHGAVLDLDVEKVQLLVAMGNVAMLVDPEERVLDLGAGRRGLVDADVDGEAMAPCLLSDAQDKLRLLYRLGKGDGFVRVGCYIVGSLGEKQGFCT